jgi:UDP-3-O-[3-hydroxymyristoyl] glucosamine N-acyltransferase
MKLGEIASRLGCELSGDGNVEIERVCGIDSAGTGDLTFVANPRYTSRLRTTRASAVILDSKAPAIPIPTLRTSNPYLAFARAIELFYQPPAPPPGIHPTAVISSQARVGADASIGPYCVVGPECVLGARVVLHPHVVLYPDVTLGDAVVLHAHVVVREHCRIGNRVVVQNGAVVGGDGFGFAPVEDGTYYKIVQSGRVVLEDDVEIGANTTVDRAAVGDTVIRRGAKLDNLVQVGHGSEVGEDTVIAAQAGLAGSTHLGKGVKVGGQAGFAGHLTVGDRAVFIAQSATSHDVEAGRVIGGSPGFDSALWLRAATAFPRLPDLLRRVRELEREVERLKGAKKEPADSK